MRGTVDRLAEVADAGATILSIAALSDGNETGSLGKPAVRAT
jgi:hypothetical protein